MGKFSHMNLRLPLFSFVVLLAFAVQAQTTIYTQDFETANSGYTPSATEGTVGDFTDIFNRSNPNIGGNSSFIFAIEDTGVTPATITLDQINVSGFTDFTFSIDLLAHHYNDWDSTDEVLIKYSIDGGAQQDLLWVQSVDNSFNEPAAIDTNFDGVGECTPSTLLPALSQGTADTCTVPNGDDQFKTFSAPTITLNGNSTLDIVIEVNNLTSADEGIYFDNILVQGTGTGGNAFPSITNISINPNQVTSNDPVDILADITDSDGTVSSAVLNWGTTSGNLPNSITMNNTSGVNYQTATAIPVQADGTTVFYTITATDDDNDTATTTESSYTVQDPISSTIPYTIDFTTDDPFSNNWIAENVVGAGEEWQWQNGGGVEMNAFASGCQLNEDWLISPAFDLDSYDNEIIGFILDESFDGTTLELLYSTDYSGTGDPNAATWNNIGNYDTTVTESNNAGLQGVSGTSVYVAFKYEFTGGSCSEMTLSSFSINGTAAGVNVGPVISNVALTPSSGNITSSDDVVVTADITDPDGILSATLYYGFSSMNTPNTVTMTNTVGDEYSATIPSQANGTDVFYYVEAEDNLNLTSSTTEDSYNVFDPVTNLDLIISEVADPDDNFESRFVELYNNGSTPIDFSNITVYLVRTVNNGSSVQEVQLTGNLAAGDFYVVASNQSNFETDYTPQTADLYNGSVPAGNGDDSYGLYINGDSSTGTLLDVYGAQNVDGTGEAWEYEDSRAFRNNLNVAPTSTWNTAEWTIETANTPDMTPGIGEPVVIDYVWDGATWSPASPEGGAATVNDNITLQASFTFTDPTIQLNNLTVDAGATMTSSNSSFSVYGDVINNGIIDLVDGTVSIEGSAAVLIDGVDITINDLFIANTNTVTIDDAMAIEVLNEFSLGEGTVNSTDGIILNSDQNGTADLTYINGSLNGTIVAERYAGLRTASPVTKTYRFVAPALNSTQTIFENWQENGNSPAGFGTHITGSTSGANGLDATQTGEASMFTYDPSTQTATGQGWEAVLNTSSAVMNVGDAYRLFVRGDRNFDLNNPVSSPSTTTLRMSGIPALGNVVVPVSDLVNEYTFVGNPYPAAVDVDNILQTSSTNVNNAFYVWDPNLGTYGAYVTVQNGVSTPSSSPADGIVESGHSFFVQTTSNGPASLTFTEASKQVGVPVASFSADEAMAARMEIQLKGVDGNTVYDAVAIGYDRPSQLVDKLQNPYENLFISDEGRKLAILDKVSVDHQTQLGVSGLTGEEYVLEVRNNSQSGMVLIDHVTGNEVDLIGDMIQYRFTNMGLKSATMRFSLSRKRDAEALSAADITVYPNPVNLEDKLTALGFQNGAKVNVSLVNMQGQRVFNEDYEVYGNLLEVKNLKNLSQGIYFVTFASEHNSFTKRIILK